MALTLRGNGQITSDNYTIDSDGDISARDTSITGNITVNGTISATKGSEATNQDADIGIYHSFRNTSATLSTGVGISLGSNNNPGTCIYAQRTGANNEHRLGFQTRNNSGSSTTRMVIDGSGNTIWNGGGFSTSNINAGSHSGAYMSDAGTLYTSRATSSNSLHWYIHNSNGQVGHVATDGSGTIFGTTSDKRLKTDIKPIENATDKIMSMNPINHKWKSDTDLPAVDGFIAQEMINIIPESVSKPENDDEMMNMDYGRITPVIVAALQDALKEIKELKEKIESMENTNGG